MKTLSLIYAFHLLLCKPLRRINSPLFLVARERTFLLACQHFSYLSNSSQSEIIFFQIYVQSRKCGD